MAGVFGRLADGVQTKRAEFSPELAAFFGGLGQSKAGVTVTLEKALGVTTILAGARRLSEDVAGLPLKVQINDDSKANVPDHWAYDLLVNQPNEWQSEYEFREGLMLHAVLTHGAIAYINRVNGQPRELLPICTAWKVRQLSDWSVVYDVWDKEGVIGTFPKRDILHIRGPGMNGYDGWDILQLAKEAIGLSIATEESQAQLHANGVRAGGLLSIDESLSGEARERLKKALSDMQGVQNAFKTMVLDKGAKWSPFAMSGVDAQHDETRSRQIEECCRVVGVFPQMIGHAGKQTTFQSAEAFFDAHVKLHVMPWVRRTESAFKRDLLSARADRMIVVRHTVQGLMRGSHKDRGEYYGKALGAGGSPAWMSQDEVRGLEDLPPMGGAAAKLPIPTNVGGGKPPSGGDDV